MPFFSPPFFPPTPLPPPSLSLFFFSRFFPSLFFFSRMGRILSAKFPFNQRNQISKRKNSMNLPLVMRKERARVRERCLICTFRYACTYLTTIPLRQVLGLGQAYRRKARHAVARPGMPSQGPRAARLQNQRPRPLATHISYLASLPPSNATV